MPRRLPSLNALRAFEAAARHGSFTLAARELFVTHAAVSRHVRELEEWLAVKLFTRTGRGVKLAEAGREFSSRLSPIFDQLADAVREVMGHASVRKLAVTVEPSFASRWLVPRLGGFSSTHPDIEIMVSPSSAVLDIAASEFDLGIRTGNGQWEGVEATLVSEYRVFPICSPELIDGATLSSPGQLADYPLLHTYSRQWWADWLKAAGVEGIDGLRGPMFQDHLAIEAAEAGQGFALGYEVLTTDALAQGWLVRPFEEIVKEPGGYFLVRAKGTKETPTGRAFREWMLTEMTETHRRFATLKPGQKTPAAPRL